MKKTITVLLLMTTFSVTFAQNYRRASLKPAYSSFENTSEISVDAGLTAFLGDLGGTRGKGEPFSKDLNGVSMRPHFGLSYGYYPATWAKVMVGLNYTTITGADSVIKSKVNQSFGRYERNLSFRSRVEELSLSGEIYPLQLFNRIRRETLVKPFIGVGVGVFHFNPEAELNGDWIKLKPLRLEGEGFTEYPDSKEYSLYQFYIPITLGFKYRLDDQITLGFSAIFRKTFTDYLDDVSKTYIDPSLFSKYLSASDAALAQQLYYRGTNPGYTQPQPGSPRSNSSKNDSYTTLAVSFSYNFGQPKERDERVSDRVIKVRRFHNKK